MIGEHKLRFALISEAMEEREKDEDSVDWDNSPWGWIAQKSPKAKGVIFENLLRRVLEFNGIPVGDRTEESHDFVIHEYRVEVKTAFVALTKTGKKHGVWNWIKTDGYDYMYLFMIFPDAIKAAFLNREALLEHISGSCGQKYTNSNGVILDVVEGGPLWDYWMGICGNFEETFEKSLLFFKRNGTGDFLRYDNGCSLMEES